MVLMACSRRAHRNFLEAGFCRNVKAGIALVAKVRVMQQFGIRMDDTPDYQNIVEKDSPAQAERSVNHRAYD